MRFVLAVAVSGLVATASWADGGFYSYTTVAPPTIPHQRAFVVIRNGIETMIVESELRGADGEYGWLVPVPSKEVKVEAVSPGLFDSLDQTLQPVFGVHKKGPWLVASFAAAGAVILASVLVSRRRQPIGLADFSLFSILLALFATIAGSALNRATGHGPTGATDAASGSGGVVWQKVGGYLYASVDSGTTTDPVAWLESGGFAVRASEPTLRTYLDEGWSFVALKFDRDNGEQRGPHPIKLTFEAKKPVYPMRLTAQKRQETRP